MKESLLVAALCLVFGSGIGYTLKPSDKPAPACQDGILLLEKQDLEIQNSALLKKLKALNAELETQELKIAWESKQVERDSNRLEMERQQKQGASSLVRNLRNGNLTLLELRTLLLEKTKDEVALMLGVPSKIRKPTTSSEYTVESWFYGNKVRLEEGGQGTLQVLFSSGKVQKVESKVQTN